MDNAKPLPTPMVVSTSPFVQVGSPFEDPNLYRRTVGALQYLTITRLGISFSVNKVCQFMSNPLDNHWKSVKRILCYLKGTSSHGLHLKKSSSLSLQVFCDTDWASCVDDRRSTSRSCIFLGSNLVSWSSKKQPTVSRSSTEAEYKSIVAAAAEVAGFESLLKELNVQSPKTPCYLV